MGILSVGLFAGLFAGLSVALAFGLRHWLLHRPAGRRLQIVRLRASSPFPLLDSPETFPAFAPPAAAAASPRHEPASS